MTSALLCPVRMLCSMVQAAACLTNSCKIAGWLLMHRRKYRSLLLQTPPQTLHVPGVVIILTGQRQPWVLSASALVVTLLGCRRGMQQAGAEVSCALVL